MKNTMLALLVSAFVLTSTGFMNAKAYETPGAYFRDEIPEAVEKQEMQTTYGTFSPDVYTESYMYNGPTSTEEVLKELKNAGVDTSSPVVVGVAQDTAAAIAADPASAQEQMEAVTELLLPLTMEEEVTTKLTSPLTMEEGPVVTQMLAVLPGLLPFYPKEVINQAIDKAKARLTKLKFTPTKKPGQVKRLENRIAMLEKRIAKFAELSKEEKIKRLEAIKARTQNRLALTKQAKPLTVKLGEQRDRIVNRLTNRLEVINMLLTEMK